VASSIVLTHENVTVRVLRMRDAKILEKLILGNREWLRPWEATNPDAPNSFDIKGMVRGLIKNMRADQGLPLVIEFDGNVVGQLNVANILFGSVSSAVIGYWIIPEVAGRGVTTTAVALTIDYLLTDYGLHRVEIDIRPENAASLRIVEKLGLRYEGLKQRYIHINGDWRDHYIFAITNDEIGTGLLRRWLKNQT
jgi:[ribosomal protein S5]-alanine N-acetyltransferase